MEERLKASEGKGSICSDATSSQLKTKVLCAFRMPQQSRIVGKSLASQEAKWPKTRLAMQEQQETWI